MIKYICLIYCLCNLIYAQSKEIEKQITDAVFSENSINKLNEIKNCIRNERSNKKYITEIDEILVSLSEIDSNEAMFLRAKRIYNNYKLGKKDTIVTYDYDFTGNGISNRMSLKFWWNDSCALVSVNVFEDGQIIFENTEEVIFAEFNIDIELYIKYFKPYIISSALKWSVPRISKPIKFNERSDLNKKYKDYLREFNGYGWILPTNESDPGTYFWFKPENKFICF